MSELKRKKTQRKQAACGELRSLATEVGVPLPDDAAELKEDDFIFLLALQAFLVGNASKPLPRSKGALSFAHDSLAFYLR